MSCRSSKASEIVATLVLAIAMSGLHSPWMLLAYKALAGEHSQEATYVRQVVFGCRDLELWVKAQDMAIQNDTEAFLKVMIAGVITGNCRRFEIGERVHVIDRNALGVKLRPHGQLSEYWTSSAVFAQAAPEQKRP